MNCNEARLHWDMYYDSEGDPEVHLQLNEHLGSCDNCADWFNKQARLESLIEQHLVSDSTAPQASHVDWSRLLAHVTATRTTTRASISRMWLMIASPVAATAAVVLVALWLHGDWLGPDRTPNLSQLTSEFHQHVSAGSLRPEIESESDLEVDKYFLNQVSFPVRCPPRKDSGFAVKGAGRCELANQPAAYVVGNVDQQPVSIFVLPVKSLEAFPTQRNELQREAMLVCREGRNGMVYAIIDKNVVLVVGNVALEKLTRVLKSYGTYPHAS